jgi:PHS family inorganic phosphate transporter-like MFS transporter
MQGVANCLSPLLAIIFIGLCGTDPVLPVSNTTKLPLPGATPQGDGLNWRFVAGLGALPGILLIPFKVSESKQALATQDENSSTPNPTSDDAEKGQSDSSAASQELSFWTVVQDRKYWPKIMGTAGGWFLFDITFYGNSLFQSTVLRDVFNQASSTTVEGDLSHNVCLQMLIIALMGLPGYYVSVYFMDSLGRRNIQLQGFFFMALTFAALGIFFDPLKDVPGLMMILYGLTFFFSNFGPNSTTFVLPAETYPKQVRTTLNGFSAAMGKAGATLGSSVFKPLSTETSVGFTMCMCAIVSLLGLILTWFCVEDRRGKEMEDGGDSEDMKRAGDFSDPLIDSNSAGGP